MNRELSWWLWLIVGVAGGLAGIGVCVFIDDLIESIASRTADKVVERFGREGVRHE